MMKLVIDRKASYDSCKFARDLGYTVDLSDYERSNDESNLPTQSELQKWLREEWNMNIVPVRVASHFDNSPNHVLYLNGIEWWISSHTRIVETGYEECLEKGIVHTLNVILKEKKK
jgi:hypothetical protein